MLCLEYLESEVFIFFMLLQRNLFTVLAKLSALVYVHICRNVLITIFLVMPINFAFFTTDIGLFQPIIALVQLSRMCFG